MDSESFKQGKIAVLLELSKMVKGMVVNGICRGVVTEEELEAKLVEVENDK